MPLYEITFITRQDASSQEVEKITESFSKIITDYKGKVIKTEQWGLRDLAYIIKKSSKGYYTFLGVDASVEAIKEFERKIKLNEYIIRCLTFRVEEISDSPSALIASEDYGDEIVIGGEKEEIIENTEEV